VKEKSESREKVYCEQREGKEVAVGYKDEDLRQQDSAEQKRAEKNGRMMWFNGEARHEWPEFVEKFMALKQLRLDGMKPWRIS